jgi:hypothetical protein
MQKASAAIALASLWCVGLLTGCGYPVERYPWLQELDAGAGVKVSGERLMALPEGLHPLEANASGTELLIGVHGMGSRGYEWVYPLQTLDDEQSQVWFFRWNDEGCPGPTATRLSDAVAGYETTFRAL